MSFGYSEASIGLLIISALTVAATALTHKPSASFAVKSLRKRARGAFSIILSLSVISAVVTASLCLGDSIRHSMDKETLSNLQGVDIAVRSLGLFNSSYSDAIRTDTEIANMIEISAPLLILSGAASNTISRGYSAQVNVIGITQEFLEFGTFSGPSGQTFTPDMTGLDNDSVIINHALASELGAGPGSQITFRVQNPSMSIDTLFSSNAKGIDITLRVTSVVQDTGLGRFNLGATGISKNAFTGLGVLQNALGAPVKINTVVLHERDAYRTSNKNSISLRLSDLLDANTKADDVGFIYSLTDHLRIDSKNVFFGNKYLKIAFDVINSTRGFAQRMDAISPLCTYFVYALENNGKYVPYSTVEGFDTGMDAAFGNFYENITGKSIDGTLKNGEIIVTNYTAMKLGLASGSTINVSYQIIDNAYHVQSVSRPFTVKSIVDMQGKAKDTGMPPYPGITGKSCYDWNPPIYEINSSMLQKYFDLEYWITWNGAPKAYVGLDDAQAMWGNDLGTLTTLKIHPAVGCQLAPAAIGFLAAFNSSLTHADAGLFISEIKDSYLASSEGSQVLTETFVSFGMVVIASSLIVSVFFISAAAAGRKQEMGILRSVGMRRNGIVSALWLELAAYSTTASFLGILLGLAGSWTAVNMINRYLPNILESSATFYFNWPTLAVSFSASLLTCLIICGAAAYANSRIEIAVLLRSRSSDTEAKAHGKFSFAFPACMTALVGIGTVILAVPWGGAGTTAIYKFFSSGFLLALGISGIIVWAIGRLGKGSGVTRLAAGNIGRVRTRSWATIAVTSLVVFTIISLSIYGAARDSDTLAIVDVQGGGYDIYAETSQPVLFNLGSPNDRATNNINETAFTGISVVQFLSFGPPGGTCTNLRKSLPPRLIGANTSFIVENKMKFYEPASNVGPEEIDSWKTLSSTLLDGALPVIGDYNTVLWILQKARGDRLEITAEDGTLHKLAIVAVLENTVFQGSLFISEKGIRSLYPTKAQYNVFLFSSGHGPLDSIRSRTLELERAAVTLGLDGRPVLDIAKDSMAVDGAYIVIFQSLTVAGLFIGTVGTGALALRSVRERKVEIGVLRSLGLRRVEVALIIVLEYTSLAVAGIIIGCILAFITGLIIFGAVSVSWPFIITISVAVVAITMAAVLVPARRASNIPPAEALRVDD